MPATRLRMRRPGGSDTRRTSALKAWAGPVGSWPRCAPAGRPYCGGRKRGAPGQRDIGRESHSPSGAEWRMDTQSAWPLPSGAAGRQRRRARLHSGDVRLGWVRERSDGRRCPSSLALRIVREFSRWPRLLRRAIAYACPKSPGWPNAARATIPSAKSILRLYDAVTIPEEERDNPAHGEGKSTHKKKQYLRKTLGVAVENVSRFCPTKIGD